MSRSLSRRRHCKHSEFDRLVRRAGSEVATDKAFAGVGNGVMSDLFVDPSCPDGETVTVTFADATNFAVSGDSLGAQAAGVTGTPYVSDNGEFGFLITVGGTPFVITDAFSFMCEIVAVGHQANLNKSDRARFAEDQTNRLGDVDGSLALSVHPDVPSSGGYCADGDSVQDPGDRSNQFTFEDVEAAQSAGDIGLT